MQCKMQTWLPSKSRWAFPILPTLGSYYYPRQEGCVIVVCLSVCWQLCCAKTSKRICMKSSGKVGSGPVNKLWNFGGDLDHRLDTGIVSRVCRYWEIWKVVSTDCTVQRCSVGHAVAGIAIATMTSLRHQLMTDSHDRRALAEVCTVRVLLVHFLYWHYQSVGRVCLAVTGCCKYVCVSCN